MNEYNINKINHHDYLEANLLSYLSWFCFLFKDICLTIEPSK